MKPFSGLTETDAAVRPVAWSLPQALPAFAVVVAV
jgi:hypothetical protein